MENAFFEFVQTYWSDIAAFIESFKEFMEALIAKFSAEEEAQA